MSISTQQRKHLYYLNTDKTVCEQPRFLGHLIIHIDRDSDGPPCIDCSQLLSDHQGRKERFDRKWISAMYEDADALSPAQGILVGFIISTLMYTALFILWYLLKN